MKSFLRLLVTLLFLNICHFESNGQKVLRVNNDPKINAPYRTLQDAHDAAVNGDIIQIEGSQDTYTGGLVCTKKLTITGTGYLLKENAIKSDIWTSNVSGTLAFKEGSSGSIIQGISGGSIGIQVSNILIRRNSGVTISFTAPTITGTTSDSIVIMQNWATSLSCSYNARILIKNNVLTGLSLYKDAIAVIQNNIFTYNVSAYNSTLVNNIQSGAYDNGASLINCTFSNNISTTKTFGDLDGNKSNIDLTTIFVGNGAKDVDFKLRANSPAIKAGLNGIDCGIFAGDTPYIMSGIPPIPTITSFNSAGAATKEISITISGKSNK